MRDRERWNLKYKNGWRTTLNATLLKFYTLAKKDRALDIACGSGDNAIFLAEKAFLTDAFDISDVAIEIAKENALKRGIKVNFLRSDAESFEFKPETYDLILNLYFLDRQILPKIESSLKEGGILIFETYNLKHLKVKPTFNRDFLLREGELKEIFKNLEVLYYDESTNITTFVAKKVSSVSCPPSQRR